MAQLTLTEKLLLPLLLLGVFCTPLRAADDPQAVQDQLQTDRRTLQVTREALGEYLAFMETRPDLFPPQKMAKAPLLTREQRLTARQTWQGYWDHLLGLDSLRNRYAGAHLQCDGELQKDAFRLAFAAFLAEYRYALDFIARAERNPAMHIILNEQVPELGLAEGSYALLKRRFLNAWRGTEFAALNVVYRFYGPKELVEEMKEDSDFLWQAGGGTGPVLTVQNALQIVQDAGFAAWLPVQQGVSQWMGDTKVWRPHRSLITEKQIQTFQPRLEPGDILLERREWYLSNLGLPGFWPHVALYVGTPEERNRYFNTPSVRNWVRAKGQMTGNLEDFLRSRHAEAYEQSLSPREGGHPARVIEAISEGVSFTSLEHSAAADSLVVLRPRLPKTAKAWAISLAFFYSGRPYDFNFDFQTDHALVCSELVYKAYEQNGKEQGLRLPVTEILGRKVLPPNEIVRQFDQNFQTEAQQLDLILFLDGNEKQGKAAAADLAAFRQSWRRPKWHLLTSEGN